ncbi:hypothetical protein PISMIDRAFT_265189 [Pisolithus microcarpus 441]|uniref:Unplaced genomic scaffold scaffold_170, whole genome shotgun sequence n=1 Tax=Pisolithus microcarpus 441 TaxID=765257 RepID=A0A0C9XVV7_9AGAM|nr:hypothetical protein PISMIDRAFT_265189 [Pisolithus microcarpus 441]
MEPGLQAHQTHGKCRFDDNLSLRYCWASASSNSLCPRGTFRFLEYYWAVRSTLVRAIRQSASGELHMAFPPTVSSC